MRGLNVVHRESPEQWPMSTSLFVPETDRLFLAVRAGLLGSGASIQIYRPTP
jgi:hypothetical protein